jgi:hypothetical protein
VLSPNEGANCVVQERTKDLSAVAVLGGDEPIEPGVVENSNIPDIIQRKVGMRGVWDDGESDAGLWQHQH